MESQTILNLWTKQAILDLRQNVEHCLWSIKRNCKKWNGEIMKWNPTMV